MSTFTLAVSCLITSNLPWFMDLTFQVSMQYCSLQHQILLPSPVPSTTGCCFCFGSISSFGESNGTPLQYSCLENPRDGGAWWAAIYGVAQSWTWLKWLSSSSSIYSFFLDLFLHWSPVAYWAPADLGNSSFSILSFCLFILFMGFSRQEYWSGLPFPSPGDHILSELSPMTHPSWVALHGMAHSFIELDKAVVHVIRLVSFLWLWFSVCLLSDGEGKRLTEASWWERLTEGETRSCSDVGGGGMLSKSLIQIYVDEWSCVSSLLFTWHQTLVEVKKIIATSFKRSHTCTAILSAPNPAAGPHWPTPPLETPGHS